MGKRNDSAVLSDDLPYPALRDSGSNTGPTLVSLGQNDDLPRDSLSNICFDEFWRICDF